MPVRIFRLVSKICVKNILRIFQPHFRENVKNTEPGRKFHHSYKKSVYERGGSILDKTSTIKTKNLKCGQEISTTLILAYVVSQIQN